MKKRICAEFVVIFTVIALAAGIVPNRKAVVSGASVGTAICSQPAYAMVDGDYTNRALQSMGLSSIHITGVPYYNNDLTGAPHTGKGNGRASANQLVTVTVTSDAAGKLTFSDPVIDNSFTTTPCEPGE